MKLKAMPLRPVLESTPFKHGKSMTEQLIQERKQIERSAIPPKKSATLADHRQGVTSFNCKMPVELLEKLKDEAKQKGISQRELLRQVIRFYFGAKQ